MVTNKKFMYRVATFAAVATLGMTTLTGCSSNKGNNAGDANNATGTTTPGTSTTDVSATPNADLTKTVYTIDGNPVTLQDMMYIIYTTEADANQNAMYATYFGGDFWEEVDEETGLTGRQATKQSALEVAQMVSVLYDEAVKNNLTLTEDDIAYKDEEIESILSSMTPEYLAATGFTKENLDAAITKYYLALQYYQQELDKIDVDEEAIKADYDYEEYRQNEIEYIYMPTILIDDEGNDTYLTAEQIKTMLEKGNEMLASVKSGKTIEEAVEASGTDIEQIDYGTFAIYADDEDQEEMEESLYKAFNTLKVGDIYDGLVEVEDGYYIIRFLDDNCTEDYDQIIEEQVYYEKEVAYSATYEELAATHEITVNEDVWNNIEIGNLAYEPMDFDFDVETTDDEEGVEAAE